MGDSCPYRWILSEKHGDAVNIQNFKIFRQQWKNYSVIKALDTKTAEIQKAYLESCLDAEGLHIYNRYMENFTQAQKSSIANILDAFEAKLAPKTTARYCCFMFQRIEQQRNETIDEYVNRLWKMAKMCKFENLENKMVCNQFIFGLYNENLRNKLLKNEKEDLNLSETIEIAKMYEMHDIQIAKMKLTSSTDEESINKIDKRRISKKDLKTCKFCNKKHIFKKESCPAWGKSCSNCNKENHFARCCPEANKRNNNKSQAKSKRIKKINEETSSDSDDEVIKSVEQIGVVSTEGKILRCNMYMKNCKKYEKVGVCLDTGASCCVIGDENLKKIIENPILQKSSTKLKAFNGKITKVIAETIIKCKTDKVNKHKKVLFQVIEGNLEPLLSSNACQVMKLIKINTKNIVNKTVSVSNMEECNKIIQDYGDVFEGEGEGKISKEISFEVDETVVPVQEKPRRIPITVRKALKNELDRLEEKDIIEKVVHSTDWVSNIVIIKKRDKDKIRICLDPQFPNTAIKRPMMQSTTIDEILPELEKAKIFTVLDAKNGYYQVPLHENSRDITAFWAPFGRYRFKVLPFGINASGDVYQQKQFEVIQGLKGIENIADDILVIGKGDNEEDAFKDHNENLKRLLKKCRESNMKLNKQKMKLAVKEVKFYGHKLTTKGVTSDEDKTNAIVKMKYPENIKEIQKFLGMVTYLSMYLPNMSKVCEPLREVIKSKKFIWERDQKECFEKIKKLIVTAPVLKYYSVDEEVVIQTDGSRKGLGAVMMQEGQPVMFISKALSSTEKNYSQCDIELLAIVFACIRLDQFICGKNNVIIETDHIALKQIFKKPIYKCTRRVQHLRLKLQRYSLTIRYCPGKKIVIADLLSRLPLDNNEQLLNEEETVMQSCLHKIEKINILKNDEIDDNQINEIRIETKKDKILQNIIRNVADGGWADTPEEIRNFKSCQKQLSIYNGILMKDEKFVIPKAIQPKYLNMLHYGHCGIQATLERARRTIFWPGISKDIKDLISRCKTCLKYSDIQQKLPMLSHDIPSYPFERISMDFWYKNKSRNILVAVDHFSDFIEINMMKSTTAESVILACKMVFTRYGIPQKVITDGAHNFVNKKFLEFAKEWNFKYINSSPYYPRGNGKAESAVKIIEKIIKKCEDSDQCIYKALLEYHNTPNATGYSPAERIMSRSTRSTIPIKNSKLSPKVPSDVKNKITNRRQKSKYYYDKHAKEIKDLEIGTDVVVKLRPTDKSNSFGKISKKLSQRAYEITIGGKTYVRNRQHIKEIPENKNQRFEQIKDSNEEGKTPNENPTTDENAQIDIPDQPQNDSVNDTQTDEINHQNPEINDDENSTNNDHQPVNDHQATGRPRRIIKKPAYLNDYTV